MFNLGLINFLVDLELSIVAVPVQFNKILTQFILR